MAFVGILPQIKFFFGPLVIQLVWYILKDLKQLFTSVAVKVVYIYLAAKYPPIFTSTYRGILARGRDSTDRAQWPRANIPQYGSRVSSLLYGTRVMLVCFLLKRTSGHLNSKGFLRVLLMTREQEQEQAISLKTNSMSVNRAEYK